MTASTASVTIALPDLEEDRDHRVRALRNALMFLEDEARSLGVVKVAAVIASAVDASNLVLGHPLSRPARLDA